MTSTPPATAFWERQFAPIASHHQRVFDWLFGVGLPLICLAIDPLVFRGFEVGELGMLEALKPYAFTVIGIGIGVLTYVLTVEMRQRRWHVLFATILFLDSIYALILGVVLLPYSLMGLIVVIGILGFTPFFTAWACIRNGIRLLKQTRMDGHRAHRLGLIIAWVLLALFVPLLVQTYTTACLQSPSEQAIVGTWISSTDPTTLVFAGDGLVTIDGSSGLHRRGVYRAMSAANTLQSQAFKLNGIGLGWEVDFDSQGDSFTIDYAPTDGMYSTATWQRSTLPRSTSISTSITCRQEMLQINLHQLPWFNL